MYIHHSLQEFIFHASFYVPILWSLEFGAAVFHDFLLYRFWWGRAAVAEGNDPSASWAKRDATSEEFRPNTDLLRVQNPKKNTVGKWERCCSLAENAAEEYGATYQKVDPTSEESKPKVDPSAVVKCDARFRPSARADFVGTDRSF